MNLFKYDLSPVDPLAAFDRFFDRALAAGSGRSDLFESLLGPGRSQVRVDLYDDGDHYTVRAEFPGVSKENLKVELENAVLTIVGERAAGDAEGPRVRLERSLTVGDDINPEGVRARLSDGILTVTLPKSESVKPRAITVE